MLENIIASFPEKDLSWMRDCDYVLVNNDERLEELIQDMLRRALVGTDTETTGLSYTRDVLVGLSVSTDEGRAYYVPVRHKPGGNLPFEKYISLLHKMQDMGIQTTWFNAKFDWHMVTKDYGSDNFPFTHDVQAKMKLINSNDKFPALKDTVKVHLGFDMLHYEDNFKGAQKVTMNFADLPVEEAVYYACSDGDMTLRMDKKLEGNKLLQQQQAIYELEMQLVPALGREERWGITLDPERFDRDKDRLQKDLDSLDFQLKSVVGDFWTGPMDKLINSPQKLGELLYSHLGIPYPERAARTQKGALKVDKKVLSLLTEYPVVQSIQKWKKLDTFLSRTLKALPTRVSDDGKLHTSFGSVDANTGRLNSSKLVRIKGKEEGTNLQQVAKPIESAEEEEEDFAARGGFVASPGYYLISVDYSQIEYRLGAGFSQDKRLLDGYARGIDYHTMTASLIFNVPPEKVTKEQRKVAKTFNFGLNYGQSPAGLAFTLKCSRQEAQALFDTYWRNVPEFAAWRKKVIAEAKKTGWTSTYYGRLRELPGINSPNSRERGYWERTVISHIIQGSAADVMKKSIVRVDDFILSNLYLGIRVILNVHDEHLFEVPNELPWQEAAKALVPVIEWNIPGCPPLIVDVEIGPTWGDLEEMDLSFMRSVPGNVLSKRPVMPPGLVGVDPAKGESVTKVISMPSDSTVGRMAMILSSFNPKNDKIAYLSITDPDIKKLEVLKVLCQRFPGDFDLVLNLKDRWIQASFEINPSVEFRDYLKRIYGDSFILHSFTKKGEPIPEEVVFEEIQFS